MQEFPLTWLAQAASEFHVVVIVTAGADAGVAQAIDVARHAVRHDVAVRAQIASYKKTNIIYKLVLIL